MSKTKRLRKKYRALCATAKQAADNQTKSANSNDQSNRSDMKVAEKDIKSSKINQKDHVNALYDIIIDSKGSRSSMDVDLKSNCSISKSIKSNLSGQSILKKDKRRLKHELFLKKLETSAELMKQLKKTKQSKKKKIDLNDDLPSLTFCEEKLDKTSNFITKNLKTCMKNQNSGRGLNKRRNAQMMKDIEQFQNLLKKDSANKNPFEEVQRRIVDRLSKESIESMNIS